MIRAIIFDCFGVLVEASLEPFYKKYFQGKADLIAAAEERMQASNRGEITYEQFVQYLAQAAGISYEEAYIFLDSNPKNEELLQYIRKRLKPSFKIGFLSNASDDWLEELFTGEDLALFDAFVLSYQTGFAKPEAQIYEIAAEKLGVRLDECLFIDDREDYCEGARSVGMRAVQYTDFENCKNAIEELLP